MQRALTATFASMREVALGLPGKCADAVQPHTALDRGAIADILRREVCEMLEALSEAKVVGEAADA